MNLVYLASPIYIIGAILLFMVVVGMLYKLFCMNVKESFDNDVDMAGVFDQIDDFDEEAEEEEEYEEEEYEDEEDEEEEGEYEESEYEEGYDDDGYDDDGYDDDGYDDADY